MVDFKIKPESIKFDYGAGNDGETWASIENARNNLRTYNNTEITGITVDGKPFSLRGTTPKDKPAEVSIKEIHFDGKEFELNRPMLVGKNGNQLTTQSTNFLEDLVNQKTIKGPAADGIWPFNKGTIELREIKDQVSSLDKPDNAYKTMLAALSETTALRKVAKLTASDNGNFASVPGTKQQNNRFLS